MDSPWVVVVAASVLTVVLIAVWQRLSQIVSSRSVAWLFGLGSVLTIAAVGWQAFVVTPTYRDLFIEPAYPILSITHGVVALIGVILLAVAIVQFAQLWASREDEFVGREARQGLAAEVRVAATGQRALPVILQRALTALVSRLDGTGGAIFLIHRRRARLVLAAEHRLDREALSTLEETGTQIGPIRDALGLGAPAVIDDAATLASLRLSGNHAALIAPLVSDTDAVGLLIITGRSRGSFDTATLSAVTSVCVWLADRIDLTRRQREVEVARSSQEMADNQRGILESVLASSHDAMLAPDPLTEVQQIAAERFPGSMVAILKATSAGIDWLVNALPDQSISPQFAAALPDVLGKGRPMVINQEGTDSSGNRFHLASTLVVPVQLPDALPPSALVIRREDTTLDLTDFDLRLCEYLGGLISIALIARDARRLSLARRQRLSSLLDLWAQPVPDHLTADQQAERMRDEIQRLLTSEAVVCLVSLPGEEGMATLSCLRESTVVEGSVPVAELVGAANALAQRKLASITDEGPRQALVGVLSGTGVLPPTGNVQRVSWLPLEPLSSGTLLVIAHLEPDSTATENEQMAALAVSGVLLAVTTRQAIGVAGSSPESVVQDGSLFNELSNHLFAILGSAQLAESKIDETSEVAPHLRRIVSSSEAATSLTRRIAQPEPGDVETDRTINDALSQVLNSRRISDSLYMAGGRPREIDFRPGDIRTARLADPHSAQLLETMLNKLAALAADDDMMSVVTYQEGQWLYLDVVRHPRHFPTRDRLAGLAPYRNGNDLVTERPAERHWQTVAREGGEVALDPSEPRPAWLSLRFPLERPEATSTPTPSTSSIRILAIDDQAVILDLIEAMGQSLGYRVTRAPDATSGYTLLSENDYDLVLTDLAMPGESGIELARRIAGEYPNLPIVLVTGYDVPSSSAELQRMGIRGILRKPFRLEQLSDLIEATVKSRTIS